MKKWIILTALAGICLLLMLLPAGAETVHSGEYGTISWNLDDAGILTVSGTGEMYVPDGSTDWYDYQLDIKTAIIEDGITNIRGGAFWGCTNLTEVRIGQTVTKIGDYAFYCCFSLEEIVLPNGITEIGAEAFASCGNLKEIVLPDSVTKLGSGAFEGSGLIRINIPNSLTLYREDTVGGYEDDYYFPFVWCRDIQELIISANHPTMAFQNGLLIHKGTSTVIAALEGAVQGDYNIPSGVTVIGLESFSENGHLTGVSVPEGVVTIEGSAFAGDCMLSWIMLPRSLQSISYPFHDIPDWKNSVTIYCYENSFAHNWARESGCSRIVLIETDTVPSTDVIRMPEDLTVVGPNAFSGTSASVYIIGDQVTTIGSGAFSNLKGKSVRIYFANSEGVTIADDAFNNSNVIFVCDWYYPDSDFYTYAYSHGITIAVPGFDRGNG